MEETPTIEHTIVHIPDNKEFARMSEVIECSDIGFSSQVFVFTSEECLRDSLKILENHNIKFKLL